jgi:serralysin
MPDIPDNSTTTATVQVGGQFSDSLEVAGDRDWVAVTLTEGVSYEISLSGSGGTPVSDTYLRIYDDAGNEIAFDDDSGEGTNSLLTLLAAYSGTFFISAGEFGDNATGSYTIEVTETQPPDFLDSIDWGTEVADTSIKVYFAAAGERFDGETSLGWNDYEIQQAMLALQQFSNVCNVSFTITGNADKADFRLVTNTSDEYLGYFNPPGTRNDGVGVFSQTGTGWDETLEGTGGLEQGGYGFITLIHEFGHGMGLAHPHDGGGSSDIWQGVTDPFDSYGQFDLNQGIYTVMSYNDGWNLHPSGENTDNPNGWQGTLMAFDIALLQQKYGAADFATGDDTYVLTDVNEVGTYFACIWDSAGVDEIVYDGDLDALIDLRAAHLGYAEGSGGFISFVEDTYGGFTIANGVVIENATGGSGDDEMTGNDAGNVLDGGAGKDTLDGQDGADDLRGGSRNDDLTGGLGQDAMRGGSGRDDFIFRSVADSETGNGTQDTIEDFRSGKDRIDLSGMDAAFGGTAQDAFIWLDDGGFTETAGELRWKATADGVKLMADHDGDGDADFTVVLAGLTAVTLDDLTL